VRYLMQAKNQASAQTIWHLERLSADWAPGMRAAWIAIDHGTPIALHAAGIASSVAREIGRQSAFRSKGSRELRWQLDCRAFGAVR
jgi:hypothetical protein